MQSLKVYLKVAVSSSELEQHYSPPSSGHCFTKKHYHKHSQYRATHRYLKKLKHDGWLVRAVPGLGGPCNMAKPCRCCCNTGNCRTPIPSSDGFVQTPTQRESLNSQENGCNASEWRGATASRCKPKIQAQVLELLKQKRSPWNRKGANHIGHLSGEHHNLFKALLWHAM